MSDDQIPVVRVRIANEHAPKPKPLRVVVRYEGARPHVIAKAIEHGRPASIFTSKYLCESCGQDGEVGVYDLAPGGTVECPACGGTMRRA